MEYGPSSDLDLAIVDPHFFQMVDSEVRTMGMERGESGEDFSEPTAL